MDIFVFCALGLLVSVLLGLWLMTRIRYRVGSRHMKVVLFGICIRRVALVNIDSVSKRPGPGLTERWFSTTRSKHRILVIRKRRGLFRNVAVTPKNRYVFKTELERAVRRVGGSLQAAPPESETPAEDDSESESASEAKSS